MSDERVHSLRTEIEMVLKDDNNKFQSLAGDMETIAKYAYASSEGFKELRRELGDLKTDLAKRIKDELSAIQGDEIKIDGKNVKKMIENKIVEAITKSDIVFMGEGDNKKPFKLEVPMGSEFWKKNQELLTKTISKSLDNIDFTALEDQIPPFDMKGAITQFQNKFRQQLDYMIENDKLFDFYKIDKKTKQKVPRYITPMKLKEEEVQKVVNAIESNIMSYLSDPKNIVLGKTKPLVIDSEKLNAVVDRIKESIESIKGLDIDTSGVESIPLISEKIKGFKEQLQTMVGDVLALARQLEESKFTSTDTKNTKEAIKAVKSVKKAVAENIISLVKELEKQITIEDKDSPHLKQVKSDLAKIDEVIEKKLLYRLTLAQQELDKFIQSSVVKIDGESALVPSLSNFNENILRIVKEALETVDGPTEKFDLTKIQQALNNWVDKTSLALENQVNSALVELSAEYSVVIDNVLEPIGHAIRNIAQSKLGKTKISEDTEIQELLNTSVDDLRKKLKTELKRELTTIIKEMDFKAIRKQATEGGADVIELPKYAVEKLNQLVKNVVHDRVLTLVNSLDMHKGLDIPKSDLSEHIKYLNTQTDVLVDNLLHRAKQILAAIAIDIDRSNESIGSQSEIQTIVTDKIREISEDFIKALKNAFSVIHITNETMNMLKSEIGKQIANEIKAKGVVFTDSDFPIQLKGVVRSTQQKLQAAIKNNVEKWVPHLEPFNVDINNSRMKEPLREALSIVIKSYVQEIVEATSTMAGVKIDKGTVSEELVRIFNSTKETIEKNFIEQTSKMRDVYSKLISTAVSTAMNNVMKIAIDSIEGIIPTSEVETNLRKIDSAFIRYMNAIAENISREIFNSIGGQFKVKTSDLYPDVRRAIAQSMDTSVRELQQAFPVLEGNEFKEMFYRENLQVILNKVNETVTKSLKEYITSYTENMKEIDIKPDLALVNYTREEMQKLQSVIVKVTKEMIRQQYEALTNEIKGIQLGAISLGYTPPRDMMGSLTRPTVTPRGLTSLGYGGEGRTIVSGPAIDLTKDLAQLKFNPGGDTRSFLGSIVNTIRYITAGAIIGAPTRAIYTGARSTSQFDYELSKARQNILVKDPTMMGVATRRVYEDSIASGLSTRGADFEARVKEEARTLKEYMQGSGVEKHLHAIAKAYTRSMQDMGRAYHIASRRASDPYEAMAMTREVAKISSAEEEVGVELAAKGLESISAQWGVGMYNMGRYSNMLLKTAMLSNVTVKDLIETQQRTGAQFRGMLKGMPKEQAYATSMALSSMFVQSTGRAGDEGGTFWRAILNRPFTSEGREELERISSIKGFEGLNPYYIDKDGVKRQKDFLEIFSEIIDATRKIDDPSKLELLNSLFPRRHGATYEAIATLVADMQEDLQKSIRILQDTGALDPTLDPSDVSFKDAINAYIESILETTDEEIASYIAGLQDSYKLTAQGLATQWEITSFEIFSELKDEFSTAATYMTSVLRIFEENGYAASRVIKTFAKIGATMLASYGWDKFSQAINIKYKRDLYEKNLPHMLSTIESNKYLSEKIGDINIRDSQYKAKIKEIEDKMKTLQESDMINTPEYRGLVEERALLESERQRLMKTRAQFSNMYAENEMQLAHLKAGFTPEEINAKQSALFKGKELANQKLDLNISKLMEQLGVEQSKLDKYLNKRDTITNMIKVRESELDKEDLTFKERKLLIRSQRALGNELEEVNKIVISSEKRVTELKRLVHRADNEKEVFNQNYEILRRSPVTLPYAVDKYSGLMNRNDIRGNAFAHSIRMIAEEARTGKMDSEEFTKEISALGRSVGLSEKEISKLERKIRSLNREFRTGNIDINNYRNSLNSISSTVIGKNAVTGKNIVSPQSTQQQQLGPLDQAKPLAGMAILKEAGISIARFIPKLMLMTAVFDAVATIGDAFASRGMKDFERMSIQANKTDEYIRKQVHDSSRSWYNPLKILESLKLDFWNLPQDINYMLGRLAGGNTELPEARQIAFEGRAKGLSGDALEEYISEELGKLGLDTTSLKRKAMVAMQQEYLSSLDPFLDRKGNLLEKGDSRLLQIPMEDILEFLNYELKRLQDDLSKEEYQYNKERTKLLIKGVAEDSHEIRKMYRDHLQYSIDAIGMTIETLNERLELLTVGSLEYSEMQLKILELQSKMAGFELQKVENDFGRVDELMRRYDRDNAFTQAKHEIQKNNAILSGIKFDSSAIKMIEAKMAREQVANNQRTIAKLEELRNQFADNPERLEKINLQILQLQAEQTKLLVDIKEGLRGEISTFNLPEGIEPLSYFEHMTRGNTHRNITTRTGDVMVNVTIDKMSGDEKDIKKLENTLRKVHSDLVRDMANNVKQNMGYNYYPFFA